MAPPEGYVENFICSLATCSVKQWGYVKYQPSIPGNALFLAIIVALVGAQIYLGVRYRTGGVCGAMVVGRKLLITHLPIYSLPFSKTQNRPLLILPIKERS